MSYKRKWKRAERQLNQLAAKKKTEVAQYIHAVRALVKDRTALEEENQQLYAQLDQQADLIDNLSAELQK